MLAILLFQILKDIFRFIITRDVLCVTLIYIMVLYTTE